MHPARLKAMKGLMDRSFDEYKEAVEKYGRMSNIAKIRFGNFKLFRDIWRRNADQVRGKKS